MSEQAEAEPIDYTGLGAYLCDGKGGLRAISLDEVVEPKAPAWLWVHLDRTSPEHQAWLRERSGIDPLMCNVLLEEETRPRLVVDEDLDHLMVFLRGVNQTPGAEPNDLVSLRLWFEPRRVISLRHERLGVLNQLRERMEKGKGPARPGDLLAAIADRLLDQQAEVVDTMQDTVDEVEQQLVDEAGYALRAKLSAFRRDAIGIRRFLAPQREVLASLMHESVSWLDKGQRARLREVADRQTRLIEELDSSRERAGVAQEELNGRLSEQMNRNMYVLSLVAGIFLPLGLLTGLLGINVGGMPGTDRADAFWIVCGVLVLLTVLMLYMFRRARMI